MRKKRLLRNWLTNELKIKEFLIFQVLKQKRYLTIFLIFSLAMAGFYPVLQVSRQGINNFFFWFSLLKPQGWLFYVVFCLLFGVNFSLFSWRNDKKICSTKQKIHTGFWGGLGSFLLVAFPICPGCLGFLALLLPVGFLGFLMQYRTLVLLLSIFFMCVSLWFLGGFERVGSRIQKIVS